MKNNYLVIFALSLALFIPGVHAKTFYVTDKVLVGVYELATTDSTLIKALPTGTPIEILERVDEYAKIRSPDGTTGWVENSYLIDHKPAQLVVLDLTDQQKQINEQLSLVQAELEATQKQLVDAKSNSNTISAEQDNKFKKEIADLEKNTNQLKKELSALKQQLQNKAQQHTATVDQNKQLQETIIELRKKKKTDSKTNSADSSKPEADSQSLDKASKEVASLRTRNEQLQATLNQVRGVLNIPASSALESEQESGIVTLKFLWIFVGALILAIGGFIAGIKWLDWRNLKRHGGFRI